ncbi:hypothetical protein [Rubellicoccus peritrichatus]|uniref:Uncharacterized protein n=1 Tax=Rubellicoccus peritrichatus TaxID=3080537 RepID=A0AAQ3QWA1_9BACT|nr:hypothetical protein [Puniceicoccus sp. CR14]WOO41685.1 hypothetical protein RZN69_01195 [Puniceicoccus sp. CR14]
MGDQSIVIFAHPIPLRAGPIRLEAFLIETENGSPILDNTLVGSLIPVALDDSAAAWIPPCCRMEDGVAGEDGITLEFAKTDSGNQLLQGANIVIQEPGEWLLELDVNANQSDLGRVQIPLTILEPLPPLQSHWPWLIPLPLAIGAFIFSQRRKRE